MPSTWETRDEHRHAPRQRRTGPEVRETQNSRVANIRLAVSQRFTDSQGEARERTDWITVVAWGGLAELVQDRVKKGTEIFVRGELRARSWEQEGKKRTALEVNAAEIGVIAPRPRDHGGDRQRGSTGRDDRRGGSTGRDDGRQRQSDRGQQRDEQQRGDNW